MFWGFPGGAVVKNPPANVEPEVDSGCQELGRRENGETA